MVLLFVTMAFAFFTGIWSIFGDGFISIDGVGICDLLVQALVALVAMVLVVLVVLGALVAVHDIMSTSNEN